MTIQWYAKTYNPLQAGSLQGTTPPDPSNTDSSKDDEFVIHDQALVRAVGAKCTLLYLFFTSEVFFLILTILDLY